MNQNRIFYLLFVNTKSGNKQGEKYCQLCEKRLKYLQQDSQVMVQIINLFDQSRTTNALSYAKQKSQEQEPNVKNSVRIIICGGDGTIPWVLARAKEAALDFTKIAFGILPIGTGNDFSRSLGWGASTLYFSKKHIEPLNKIVKKWGKSQVGYYDIWDIEIDVFQDGAFYDIKNQIQHRKLQKTLRRSFTNYFGIGLDARVVYSVQKRRGSSAFINKLLYTFVGARNFFKKMSSIQSVIDSFLEQNEESTLNFSNKIQEVENEKEGSQPLSANIQRVHKPSVVTKSKSEKNEERKFVMKKGYKGLVCLNCTSYMAGLRNVWMTNESTDESLKNDKTKQNFSDGKLEFISFNNQISLALQRVMRTGVRIAQGSGPFEILFKDNPKNKETFLQIDGESVKIERIRSIRVRKSLYYPNGQIKVLIKNKNKK